MAEKILFVDDEERVLYGLRRSLEREFDLTCVTSPAAALQALAEDRHFAVIVADFRMPDMNGIELLRRAREMRPDTVRMLLTGFCDMALITEAINDGSVFRFLGKPCSNTEMRLALHAALAQCRLIHAEKELLDNTLMGCVKVFGDLVSNFDPDLHAQVKTTRAILQILQRGDAAQGLWEAKLAVLLSPIGWLTVPPRIVQKMRSGESLAPSEAEILSRIPLSTCRLLENIPRLEVVKETILREHEPCPPESALRPPRPWMVLRACRDLVANRSSTHSFSAALDFLEATPGAYHPDCLLALRKNLEEITLLETPVGIPVSRVTAHELAPGMKILDPIEATDGSVVVPQNHEIHAADIERLRNFDLAPSSLSGIRVQKHPLRNTHAD